MLQLAFAVLAVAVAFTAHSPLLGVAIAAGYLAWYAWSIKRHPYRDCWRCGGSKSHDDTTIAAGAWGRCVICKGTGKRTRWGVRAFRRKTYAEIKSGKAGRYH